MSYDPIVVVNFARTPQGNMQGVFKHFTAWQLGELAIRGAIERSGINSDSIEEVIMGCVLPAGQGQAPARQAAIHAGIPASAGATTINKMCGSGMKAVMFAHDALIVGSSEIMVAGGMESMTNAPYLLLKARGGYRLGHGQVYDHMFLDGLEDSYSKGQLMGCFAEATAKEFGYTREQQDEFATESLMRAQIASQNNCFANEMVSVTTKQGRTELVIDRDENPTVAKIEKISQLKPAFSADGTVTAANSSSISDGAAALVMMKESKAKALGLKPRAKITGHATFSQQPELFTTAPVGAIQKLLVKNQWNVSDVDLFEVNEAFAVVAMVAMEQLKIPHDRMNIYGGACALGHPVGATGARIVCTLINALEQTRSKRGVAALCIGGGEATALGVELV